MAEETLEPEPSQADENERAELDPAELDDLIPRRPQPAERRLKVVDKDLLAEAVDSAVQRSLKRRLGMVGGGDVTKIQRDVRNRLMRLVHEKGKRIRGVTKSSFLVQLQRSRNEILTSRDEAREELEGLRDRMQRIHDARDTDDEELERQVADLSRESEAELRERMEQLFAEVDAGELAPGDLAGRVVDLTARFAHDEAERLAELRGGRQLLRMENLERRINKLSAKLDQSESVIGQLMTLKDTELGTASIYREVQGLTEADVRAKLKRAMLEQVFEANLTLQRH